MCDRPDLQLSLGGGVARFQDSLLCPLQFSIRVASGLLPPSSMLLSEQASQPRAFGLVQIQVSLPERENVQYSLQIVLVQYLASSQQKRYLVFVV